MVLLVMQELQNISKLGDDLIDDLINWLHEQTGANRTIVSLNSIIETRDSFIHELKEKINIAKVDISRYTNDKKELQGIIDEMASQGVRPVTQDEQYWNGKYPTREVFYNARPLPRTGEKSNIQCDVKDFLQFENNAKVQRVVRQYKLKQEEDDETALKCLRWVMNNFNYQFDDPITGFSEFWMYPQEAIDIRKGDCEDGAILLVNLMMAAGIPYWKIRLTAGDVVYQGIAGHAYITYYCEEKNKWVLLDWCYYQNAKKIVDRQPYEDEKLYKNVWFSTNKLYSFYDQSTKLGPMFKTKQVKYND